MRRTVPHLADQCQCDAEPRAARTRRRTLSERPGRGSVSRRQSWPRSAPNAALLGPHQLPCLDPTRERGAHRRGAVLFRPFLEEEQRIFSTGVEAFTAGAAVALASTYDFGPHRRLLDVGGGTGSFMIAILRRHPALRGTLFDLPGACAVARQRL